MPIECNVVRIAIHNLKISNTPALRLGYRHKQDLILLIDDDEQVGSLTKIVLECEGYRNLHVIRDSRSVISFLKEKEVAVIVLDLMMPHIMGNELLSTLKNDFPNIPVIVMTAVDDQEMVEECLKLGALDYLVKPVAPDRLLLAIDTATTRIMGLQ